AGVYYPDKTKVGWWKNGYPEYFAKVLNAPNWIGIDVSVNGEELDLFKVSVRNFRRELNMKEGWYLRSFEATMVNGTEISVNVRRFLCMNLDEAGYIEYEVTPLNRPASIVFRPYLDAGVHNEDANWDERFWETLDVSHDGDQAFVTARTKKTEFTVSTFMHNAVSVSGRTIERANVSSTADKIQFIYEMEVSPGETASIEKIG